MTKKEGKFNRFSVSLGLLDYINPICCCITMVTIINHTRTDMGQPYGDIFLIGAIISIFFGFIIPTGKVIVGLGLIKFRMSVPLVFCVNSGILISGLMLLRFVVNMSNAGLCLLMAIIIVLLILIYCKSRKMITIMTLCLTLLAAGCQTADKSQDSSEVSVQEKSKVEEVKDRGVLKVGTTGDYQPMSYLDPNTGSYVGIDTELAEDLADSLGVDVEYVKTSWPTLMEDTLLPPCI